jgi:hypothetical protein
MKDRATQFQTITQVLGMNSTSLGLEILVRFESQVLTNYTVKESSA